MKPTDTVDALIPQLGSTRKADRLRSAKILGKLGDIAAVTPLIRALSDPAIEVRRAAADSFGRLKATEAIPQLVEAMADADHSLRMFAAGSLRKLGSAAYAPVLAAYPGASLGYRHAAIEVLWKFKKPAVTELLLAALGDPDSGLRFAAARFLGRRKDAKAVPALVGRLGETDVSVVVEALEALGAIGDASAFEAAAELLEHPHPHVVRAAIRTLRSLDYARAVDLIHEKTDEAADPTAIRLAQAVAGHRLLDAVERLRTGVKDGSLPLDRMLEAARGVGEALKQTVRENQAGTPALGMGVVERMQEVEAVVRRVARRRPD